MPHETGELEHEIATLIGDRLETHGVLIGFLAFVVILGGILTVAAIVEVCQARRDRRARQEAAQQARCTCGFSKSSARIAGARGRAHRGREVSAGYSPRRAFLRPAQATRSAGIAEGFERGWHG